MKFKARCNESTLFAIENNADLTKAKALIQKVKGLTDPANLARTTARARLIEAYERTRWRVGHRHYRIYLLI